jgi:hypothetical protein
MLSVMVSLKESGGIDEEARQLRSDGLRTIRNVLLDIRDYERALPEAWPEYWLAAFQYAMECFGNYQIATHDEDVSPLIDSLMEIQKRTEELIQYVEDPNQTEEELAFNRQEAVWKPSVRPETIPPFEAALATLRNELDSLDP